MLFHCFHFDRNEIAFCVIKYHLNITRNRFMWKETSAHFIKAKLIGFYWMGRFFQTTRKTKFYFISPAMESYANRISFHCVKGVRIQSCSSPHFFRIFSHSDLIRRDLPYLSVFSPNAGKCGKNADQNNSEYEHFLRRVYGGFKFHFGSHLNTLEIVL